MNTHLHASNSPVKRVENDAVADGRASNDPLPSGHRADDQQALRPTRNWAIEVTEWLHAAETEHAPIGGGLGVTAFATFTDVVAFAAELARPVSRERRNQRYRPRQRLASVLRQVRR